MRIVGLTGGIASGKSTVSAELQSLGVPVIDADKIAHAALKKGSWGWRRVVARFGDGILQQDGEVDRAKLGEMIFNNPAKRKLLNKAMEPTIAMGIFVQLLRHWIAGSRVVVLDAPLLFEAKINKMTKPVIVVWVDRPTQEARLMARDVCTREQAIAKIESQLSLDWKAKLADVVIDNNGTSDATKAQIHHIWMDITSSFTWTHFFISRTTLAITLISGIFLCVWWATGLNTG